MKKLKMSLLSSMTILGLFVLIMAFVLTGCEKSDVSDSRENMTSDIDIAFNAMFYRGVDVVESEQYGNYLSFDSDSHGEKIYSFLEFQPDDSLALWENHFDNYHSLQSRDKSLLADHALGTMLNSNGYLAIDDVLYRYDLENDVIYEVDGDRESLSSLYSRSAATRSSCSPSDVANTQCDEDTRCGNGKCSLWLDAEIDYVDGFWNDKIYLKSDMHLAPCMQSGFSDIHANHHIYASYSITIDGVGQSASNVYFGPSYTKYYKVLLASGDDICVNYISTSHQSSSLHGSITNNISM